MKKLIATLTLTLVHFGLLAQDEIRTVFDPSGSNETSYSGFGGPLVKYTKLNKDGGLLIGAKAGVLVNKRFAFGCIGTGLIGHVDAGSNASSVSSFQSLSYGSAGVFAEYIHKMKSPIHISVPVNLMYGGATITDNETNQKLDNTDLIIFEPGISLELNMTSNLILAMNIGHRFVGESTLEGPFTDRSLSDFNYGLELKFGAF